MPERDKKAPEKKWRLALYLAPQVAEGLKVEAVRRRMAASALAEEILRDWLQKAEKRR